MRRLLPISRIAPHEPVAHPVTHENAAVNFVGVGIGIGIAIGSWLQPVRPRFRFRFRFRPRI